MSAYGDQRRLWMLTMPGLNEQVFLQACADLKLPVKAPMNTLDNSAWTALRVRCEELCAAEDAYVFDPAAR